MMICFSGLERQLDVVPSAVSTLEIHNRILFERICRSLLSENGDLAPEPFVLCDDVGEVIGTRGKILVVESPFSLPWGDKGLSGAIAAKIIELLRDDPDLSDATELLSRQISSSISSLSLQLQSDYGFAYEWDVTRYLKAFGFGIDRQPEESVFENCMRFISLAHDMHLKKLLVFINIKLFLSENELQQLIDHIFFCNLPVVFLENIADEKNYTHERKYIVDQHFLES